MQSVSLKAPAKINLYLNVLGKRKDGYHEIESIAQSINVYDILRFEKIKRGIQVVWDHPFLPFNKNNLVYRAAELFFDITGINPGVKITVQKEIPVGAGLGGGSSDAATTLLGLNLLFEARIPSSRLVSFSSQLGTDVPFCLIRGTALLRGKGDEVIPLPSIREGFFVLVYPNIPISTFWVYSLLSQRLTCENSNGKLNTADLEKRIKSKGMWGIKDLLYNKLEEVVIEEFPLIAKIKEKFKEKGVESVLMSGSGSTVFGVVESKREARELITCMQGSGKVYLAQPIERKLFKEDKVENLRSKSKKS